MENIIKELINIENSAKDIAFVSRGKVGELKDAAVKRKEEALAEIRREADENAKERDNTAERELCQGLSVVKSELDARLATLRRYYEENRESLVRQLFERVRGESP